MTNIRIDSTQIKGWGIDADSKNDPTYPMKHRNNGEHAGYSWDRPPQQPVTIEVLHSNERPNVSAVFGTASPPAGLSGIIRRMAFNYSESSYGHWIPLMLADRVNVLEGLVEDMSRGHVPNVFKELGWNAEWQYNRNDLLARILVRTLIMTAVFDYLRNGRSNQVLAYQD